MDQIFNELSANGSYDSKYSACAGMENLACLSLEMAKIGFSGKLRTVQNFHQLPIAPDFTISDWANEKKGVDKEKRQWLLFSATQHPYIEDFMEKEQDNSLVEFKFDCKKCLGLGLAFLWDCGALSLDGDERFRQDAVEASLYQIDSNDKESTETVKILSWYSREQLPSIRDVLVKSERKSISDGEGLLSKSLSLFPALSIGQKASKQLQTFKGSEQHFQEIIRHFSVLNETMRNWKSGPFAPQGVSWSPESQPTMEQFAKEREFICSDREKRTFSLHSRISSANANLRIYFLPDTSNKTVHIGYVGTHLPTVKHRT
ncbi:MAG: hypothetical protein OXF42_00145 [Candidatus Dadabacteria bacterium]|nr:hypothetical protein [Candidatus Dadabacteria bacterium]